MAGEDSKRLRQRLESLADAGVQQLPRASAKNRMAERSPAAPGSEPVDATGAADPREAVPVPKRTVARSLTDSAQPVGSGRDVADVREGHTERAGRLDVLRAEVAGCRLCDSLASARTTTVFGSGHPSATICFFGEAPGADEDASGEPFVGRAGQLLTKIIEACGLTRDEVYILNVLKCRPPGNRQPEPGEVANCRGFFERQFDIIRPRFIVCLGTTAAQALLKSQQPIGKLRGDWYRHGDAEVICTYHPSYLLRNPAAKRDVWDDMKRLMARAGRPVPDA